MASNAPFPNLSPTVVLGAGAWGTALAIAIARNNHDVILWGRDPKQLALMAKDRENGRYIAGVAFPDSLRIEANLGKALHQAKHVLISVPSLAFVDCLSQVKQHIAATTPISWATKGLTPETGCFLHDTVLEILGDDHPLAIISGPSFAAEVAQDLPTAFTIASLDPVFATGLAGLLHRPTLRVYTTHDIIGVQIGGSIKNVLAIAAGISDGLGFGANARAALITRGLAESLHLSQKLGAQTDTLIGLAGLGDLILTCTDDQSRNRQLGLALASTNSVDAAIAQVGKTVEGIHAAREILLRAKQINVEMPIVEQVCNILFEGHNPREAVQALLCREQKNTEIVRTEPSN